MPEYCPVLRPTYEEFIHVKEYIKKIEPLVTKHGICKVIFFKKSIFINTCTANLYAHCLYILYFYLFYLFNVSFIWFYILYRLYLHQVGIQDILHNVYLVLVIL